MAARRRVSPPSSKCILGGFDRYKQNKDDVLYRHSPYANMDDECRQLFRTMEKENRKKRKIDPELKAREKG